MKIGQIVIDLYFNSELGKFYVTAAQEEVQQGPHTGNVGKSKSQDEVQLDPDSDTFEEDKAELKAAGYFFNRSSKTWRKKKGSADADTNGSKKPAASDSWYGDATEIQLSQDDPDFTNKKAALKSAGFKWNPTAKAWHKSDQ